MSHLRRLDGLRADRRDFGFPVGGDSRNIPVHVRVFAEGLVVTPAAGLATGLLISFGRLAPGWPSSRRVLADLTLPSGTSGQPRAERRRPRPAAPPARRRGTNGQASTRRAPSPTTRPRATAWPPPRPRRGACRADTPSRR